MTYLSTVLTRSDSSAVLEAAQHVRAASAVVDRAGRTESVPAVAVGVRAGLQALAGARADRAVERVRRLQRPGERPHDRAARTAETQNESSRRTQEDAPTAAAAARAIAQPKDEWRTRAVGTMSALHTTRRAHNSSTATAATMPTLAADTYAARAACATSRCLSRSPAAPCPCSAARRWPVRRRGACLIAGGLECVSAVGPSSRRTSRCCGTRLLPDSGQPSDRRLASQASALHYGMAAEGDDVSLVDGSEQRSSLH